MQKLVKIGKNAEINKQSDVKLWFNWRKHGTVSYLFSCNKPASQLAMTKFSLWSIFKIVSRKFVNCRSIYLHNNFQISVHMYVWPINSHQAKDSFRFLGQVEFKGQLISKACISFFFWENWGDHNLLSRLSDL